MNLNKIRSALMLFYFFTAALDDDSVLTVTARVDCRFAIVHAIKVTLTWHYKKTPNIHPCLRF